MSDYVWIFTVGAGVFALGIMWLMRPRRISGWRKRRFMKFRLF